MRKHLLILLISMFTACVAFAQVTTSAISGTIKDSKGVTLPGATVKAVHVPSGTTYSTSTNANGLYTIPGMRIGGPYRVDVSFIGFKSTTYEGITLQLGQTFILNTTLAETGVNLQEVKISGTKVNTSGKLGASTNINRAQIAALPSISRSIVDYTRLTPQSTGTSFAGRDNRLNNTTVDGANLNNTFGTSSDPLPGGGAQPISIEAYDEISVNIAPFDVRQAGFTGAGIYATTKSGTNTFHGSAYTYYKDQSFNGNYIGDNFIGNNVAKSKTNTYGFTVGGPIIKNKLFFFANYETEKSTNPGISYSPTNGSGTGQVTPATVAELTSVQNYLKGKGYETGGFDNFPAFQPKKKNILAKLDWNINDKNKFTIKYSYLNATSDQQVNAQSIANGGAFISSNVTTGVAAASRTNLPNPRYSANQSIAFQNSNYGFKNVVATGTAELNTRFNSSMSNQLLVAFKKYDNPRTFGGSVFPTIDIFNGANSNYITAGMDPFTNNNEVIDNSTSYTDNFTYYAGKHTLTAGINYEYQRVGNAFMPGSNGHYIYNSLDDFLNDRAPIYFSYTYSLIPGVDKVFSADLKIGQWSAYVQDEYNVNPDFKLTYGIRVDRPTYLQDPVENPQVTALQLPDQNGNLRSYNGGKFPTTRFIFSPRVGFRLNLLDDKSLVLRGGMGIFTGRIPYVSLTNAPSNSGMYQFGGIATAAQLATIKFNPNPATYANLFPQTAGTTAQPNTALLDPNYKFPQVFRTDFAAEKNLGSGWSALFEALYTKDINATKVRNANLKAPTGTINEGDLTRIRYVGTGTNNAVQAIDRAIYPNLSSVIVLENTNKGYSAAFTGQLTKAFNNGLSASVAYTYTVSKEVTPNVGSTATSVWQSNYNVGTSNDVELRNSSYYVPHRIVANASYKFNYLGHASTTVGLFLQGQAGGSNSSLPPLSYIYGNDINGDGNASDLMYIPKRASELNIVQYTATVNGVTYTYTVQQQQAALEQFINNTPYLKKHRGEFADRNAAFLPWYTRVDLNVLQDFYINTGNNHKHTLEFSAVVQNLPNLLNKYWGIQKFATTTSPVLTAIDATTGLPTYTVRQLNGKLVNTPFQDATSATTWSILIGAKYIF
ncbi:TonB-dependent receptor [Mucilaginibacter boryungensis]|uniref:TonB-dependent receptor n=1 Tax=Mucilaginibacter boryungensis TaxID=768480 RepID=A0ABR9XEH1_9SPHI|nr:TonB-dependent receptor [Mucilaginibacter boryungensis]MBE9665781.1 TonB-dependent receptor [Mucilaginibacter boryungensis]